jgi:hypothetical protein
MWRWYVEVAFLVLVCFAAGAAVAAVVLARLLPAPSDVDEPATAAPGAGPATGSGS